MYSYTKLGLSKCPYAERWMIDLYFITIRLHHWIASDDLRYPHNHPWWYISCILYGYYIEHVNDQKIICKVGSIKFYTANHIHKVQILKPCWSLVITGMEVNNWGFFVNNKFRKRNKYFFEHRHHECDKT